MPSLPMLFVAALFATLALIFAALALRARHPARRAYRRIALIFALVGATLLVLAFAR